MNFLSSHQRDRTKHIYNAFVPCPFGLNGVVDCPPNVPQMSLSCPFAGSFWKIGLSRFNGAQLIPGHGEKSLVPDTTYSNNRHLNGVKIHTNPNL